MNEQQANAELTYYVTDPPRCGNCRYFGADSEFVFKSICELSPNIDPDSAYGICDEWECEGWGQGQ